MTPNTYKPIQLDLFLKGEPAKKHDHPAPDLTIQHSPTLMGIVI